MLIKSFLFFFLNRTNNWICRDTWFFISHHTYSLHTVTYMMKIIPLIITSRPRRMNFRSRPFSLDKVQFSNCGRDNRKWIKGLICEYVCMCLSVFVSSKRNKKKIVRKFIIQIVNFNERRKLLIKIRRRGSRSGSKVDRYLLQC